MDSCPVAGHEVNLATATLQDPQLRAHPNEFYWTMRHEQPVYFDAGIGMWLVSRYEDLQTVLADPVTYSSEVGFLDSYAKGFFEEFKEILEKDGGGYFPDAIMSDPPEHTRVRKLMEKAFTAHRVKQLEPEITDVVNRLLDSFVDTGRVDGVNGFAVPLTTEIICAQLGIREFEPDKIQAWSLAVTAQISQMQDHDAMVRNARDICDLQNFLIAEIRDRQETPRDDILSDLIHARSDDEAEPTLNFREVVSLARALLIAGNETTATALGNLLFFFATRPEMAQALFDNIDDERYCNRFVEELLRLEPPVRGLARSTIREVQLGGVTLPAGAHMLLLYASANDDETVFECPRKFDLGRANIGRQVAFGAGVHRCVGLSLARMEIRVAARQIVRRLKDIQLAVPVEEIRYLPTVATRSIDSLPLTFSKR